MVFHTSAASAAYLRKAWSNIAADVIGRRLEVLIDLVPVVFGAGVRYFGDYDNSPLLLDEPEIVQGDRVTHLRYRVRK